MTDQELQALVEATSLKYFKKPFQHRAYFNSRLRTTGGRYFVKDHHLDFNPRFVEVLGHEGFIDIIKHELCHYHLHLAGLPHDHRSPEFQQLLAQVGGLRYVPRLPPTKPQAVWQYRCQTCGRAFERRRRVDVRRYVCAHCGGHLETLGMVIIKPAPAR